MYCQRTHFGVPSATAVCQKTMNNMLNDMPGVVEKVDDILITVHNETEHIRYVQGATSGIQQIQ